MPTQPIRSLIFRLALLACWLLAAPALARAQQLPTKTYTTADGLVNNRVSRIVRDSRGYLWFCTENGLSRFDGHAFINYTTEQGLPDNEVDDLLETRGGTYWVATGRGLCRYNPKGLPRPQQPASPQPDPMFAVYLPDGGGMGSAIKSLYEDRAGTVWVGTWRGLYRLEQAGDQVQFRFVDLGMPASEPQNQVVRNILEDRYGALWLTSDSGLYRRSPDGTVARFTRDHGLSSERLLGLLEDRRGRLWVGDRYGGLCLLVAAPQAGRPVVARRYTTKDGLGCIRIGALYESAEGRFWIGTDCGLAELLPEADAARPGISMALGGGELTDPQVWSLAEDNRGNLWVGTPTGAVKIIRGGFTTYTEADGLGSRTVCSVRQTAAGELYVYTKSHQESFLNRFDGKRFFGHRLNLPGRGHPVDCGTWLQDGEDRWWLAAGGQLLRFPKAVQVAELARLRPRDFYPAAAARGQVGNIYEDRRGDLWFSIRGRFRLLRWDRGAAAVHGYSEAEGLPSTGASLFAEDQAGNLWMGFGEAGLVRYAGARFERFTTADGLPSGVIRGLLVDSQGRLWVACSRGGLGRIDDPAAARPRVRTYTTADGLSSNRLRSIVEDNWGRLYIGTDQSLDRLDPATGRVKHFTTADGLVNNVVFFGFRDGQGALWFGTDTGVSRLVPEPERPQPPPVVLINRLQISGSTYTISDLGEAQVPELELGPGQNSLRIDFGGVAFGPGEVLRYQHKLEGGSQGWGAPSEQRSVNFASLAPGRYEFLVRAVNADGVASETPARFAFTVLPPVWRRWWFIALVTALAGLLAYALYRRRVARLLELERVRTRIAADLHDDIGANLTRIAILSEVAQTQLPAAPPGIEAPLSSIAQISRESVAAMGDIVWAINPRRDHLIDLVQRLRRLAGEVFAGRRIEYQFLVPEGEADLRLGADVRRDVLLVFKEAINNVARHSGCAKVRIELRTERSWLVLEVTDDGRGFEADVPGDGQGVWSMKRRAQKLGGELQLTSVKGEGTRIILKVPHRPG